MTRENLFQYHTEYSFGRSIDIYLSKVYEPFNNHFEISIVKNYPYETEETVHCFDFMEEAYDFILEIIG